MTAAEFLLELSPNPRTALRFQLSPYLNVNPSYVQTPEFIVNQEQKKGRIEQSFAGIGASVISGGAAGGTYGFYDGLRQTVAAGMRGTLRRTQIMNYTVKSGMHFLICMQCGRLERNMFPGASVSNALGTLAVMYSCVHTLASQWHEEDDEIKCLGSGLLTGALYKVGGVK